MEKNKKIIIVEDEGILALQVKKLLLQMGHSVSAIFASGENALEELITDQPDLILMDIHLQGNMDGIETAELIHKQYGIPLIFMTAHSEEATITRAKTTNPYGYLVKPLNPRELQIAVEMALYKAKIDREKDQLTLELQKALEKVKLLSGIIPICCSCKKIRDDKGYWKQVEVYIRDHSEAEFSHGICEECVKKLYPDYKK